MRYQVPQFIEVEDKIFGPFTIKQFLYMGAGAAIFFISIKFLGKIFGGLIGLPIAGFFLALALYRPNNRPFALIVESAITYFFSSKLYLWNKQERKESKDSNKEKTEHKKVYVPKLSHSKLKDLSWSLDVKNEVDK